MSLPQPPGGPAPRRRPAVGACLLLLALAVGATGCRGTLYRSTGKLMGGYATEHMLPHVMASDDVAMACEVGVSLGPFLLSFERVTDPARGAAVVSWLGAGMCAEGEAWEAELRGLRAARAGAPEEAEDARVAEKRAHAVAARRFVSAWEAARAAFAGGGGAGPEEGSCPEVSDEDAAIYLLGLSAGALAVLHDRAAGGVAGVPLDIPRAVMDGAACLDDARWWGAPGATRAALDTVLPGGEAGDDPWAALEAASLRGESAGVRLARAFQVQALAAAGREEALQAAVAAHAASLAARPPDPAWRLLDAYATLMIRHESDRLWTREAGHRTPVGALGRFPGEAAPEVDESLLEGLGTEPQE